MTTRWTDVRGELVSELGGEAVVADARRSQQAYIDAYRLTQRRKDAGLSQRIVAERMGVTKARVSQIERGEVATMEVVARYVAALGGRLQVAAVFGEERFLLGEEPPADVA